jgi:hypothetical protein
MLVRTKKIRMPVGIQTVKARFMMFQRGMGILLVIGLEVIYLTLRQGTCLHFANVLRFCGRLILKVTDELIWRRKIQGISSFRL